MIGDRVVKVYHAKKTDFFTAAKVFEHDAFKLVAAVILPKGAPVGEALEVAYELTNSLEAHWSFNPGVMTFAGFRDARSTSVGDVVVFDGKVYAVSEIGFAEIAEV